MNMKLFLASFLAVLQVFSATPDGAEQVGPKGWMTEEETQSFLAQSHVACVHQMHEKSLMFVGPHNLICDFHNLPDSSCDFFSEAVFSLVSMLSNPVVMNLYLSGVSYSRDCLIEQKIGMGCAKQFLEFLEGENVEADDESPELIEFLTRHTTEELIHLKRENVDDDILAHYDVSGLLFVCVSHALNREARSVLAKIEKDEEYSYSDEDFTQNIFLELLKKTGYQLPQKIAAHLNLDLKTDGLPRFVLSAGEKVIGFMRCGSYPKSMIDEDLKGNPDALALLGSNYLPEKGCAIAAIMLQEQYHGKGYGSAFWVEMFTKTLPWYATNPEAPKYPEGQLGQVYITHRAEQMVTAKLVRKLQADSRFTVIELGEFMSGEHKKIACLVQFVETKKTDVEPAE